MEIKLIDRIVKGHLCVGVIAAGVTAGLFGWWGAAAVVAGTVWGSANLYIIKLLILNILNQHGVDYLKVSGVVLVKFLMIYLVGYGLLMFFPYQGLILGFSLLFVVMFLLLFGSIFSEAKAVKQKAE